MWSGVNYFLAGELARIGKRVVGDKTPLLDAATVAEIGEIFPARRSSA